MKTTNIMQLEQPFPLVMTTKNREKLISSISFSMSLVFGKKNTWT